MPVNIPLTLFRTTILVKTGNGNSNDHSNGISECTCYTVKNMIMKLQWEKYCQNCGIKSNIFLYKCTWLEHHENAGVSMTASWQKGSEFKPAGWLVPFCPACSPSACMSFLSQSRGMQIGSPIYSKLSVSVDWFLFLCHVGRKVGWHPLSQWWNRIYWKMKKKRGKGHKNETNQKTKANQNKTGQNWVKIVPTLAVHTACIPNQVHVGHKLSGQQSVHWVCTNNIIQTKHTQGWSR